MEIGDKSLKVQLKAAVIRYYTGFNIDYFTEFSLPMMYCLNVASPKTVYAHFAKESPKELNIYSGTVM